MDVRGRFLINRPRVIQETFDDEVIIINLESGTYYSLDSVGADLWPLIDRGLALGEMIDTLARRYEGERLEIEHAIAGFLDELEREHIIAPLAAPLSGATPPSAMSLEADPETERRRFVPPVLHKFTDMRELLLLDPIHEVDETGWPHQSKEDR